VPILIFALKEPRVKEIQLKLKKIKENGGLWRKMMKTILYFKVLSMSI